MVNVIKTITGDDVAQQDATVEPVRYGSVRQKGCKTDPVYQTFSVRESGGFVELYNKSIGQWVECPSEWLAAISWE